MKSGMKRLAVVLAVLGAIDLVMIPFMIAAGHHNSATAPPAAAIVLNGVVGVAVLATLPAIMQGRAWAFWVAIACRAVDMVQGVLGIAAGPGALFVVVGAVDIVLSVAALVLLVRLNPRRELRRAASNA